MRGSRPGEGSCPAGRSWCGEGAGGAGGSWHGGESLLGEGSWPGGGSLQEGESLLDSDSGPAESSWPEEESFLGGRSCPGGGSWTGEGSLLGGGSSAPSLFPSSKGISLFSSASALNIQHTPAGTQGLLAAAPASPPARSPPGSSRRRAGGRAAAAVAAPGGRVKRLPSPDRAPLCQQSYLWTYPSSPGERYPVQPAAATLERGWISFFHQIENSVISQDTFI